MSKKKLKPKKSNKASRIERKVLEMVMQGKELEDIMESLNIDLFTATKILIKIQREAEYIKKIL